MQQKNRLEQSKNNTENKSVDLATSEEIMKTTNCVIGAVPPFGNFME